LPVIPATHKILTVRFEYEKGKILMNVLILGCGYTGIRLANRLRTQGIPVKVTNRTGHPIPTLDVPVYSFQYDGEVISPLCSEALDGITHVLTTVAPDRQGIDPVAASLMPSLLHANLQWFGYLSTTGVYGDTQGAWVDELSPLRPTNLRSQHRVNIEATLLKSGLPTHIFRLPGIYGTGRSIFDRLRDGTAHHIQKPGHVFSRIHVDDIVQTLWCSMAAPKPGSVYNVADDEPTEPSTLILEGAKLMGITPPPAQAYETVPLSPMAASFWSECRRVRNSKIKQEIGVELRYPTYREGLLAIWAEEQANSQS
jgi:nucleoside-diphosphate-sugar epimerase